MKRLKYGSVSINLDCPDSLKSISLDSLARPKLGERKRMEDAIVPSDSRGIRTFYIIQFEVIS